MTSTRLAVLAAFILAAFCAFSPAPASAQGRENAFAVAGVHVDETAANAAEAQQRAFTSAQRVAFQRLAQRLTLPGDRARLALPQAEGNALDQLVLSVDVEQERRSATRYIGRLTVRFDPDSVRNVLRQSGFAVVETRTAPILVSPQAVPDTPPDTAALWQTVWEEGGFAQELVPLAPAPASLSGPPSWDAAAPFAQAAAAASALFATLRVQGGTATAGLVEVGPNGVSRDRGEVAARIGEGQAGLRAALQSLTLQASDIFQNEWKSRANTGGGQRSRVSASALYSDQAQWERIKQGLEGAAATLISEIRIEAVGREGALVSFSYVGELTQLGAELNRRGVSLEQSQYGPVLRATRR